MHLATRLALPAGYRARPYAGAIDHRAMVQVLAAYREIGDGGDELPTVERMDATYANLHGCDPDTDIALIEHDGEVVAYARSLYEDLTAGTRDLIVFAPARPPHLVAPLFHAMVDASEAHMRVWLDDTPGRFRAGVAHPGPGRAPTGPAAWLEERGYEAAEWGASLVRPHLDDIPARSIPDGVEVRPVMADQIRTILEAQTEAFRHEWDFYEPTAADYLEAIEDPQRDETLWKVAWAGDEVVGQVRTFINEAENDQRGYRRGYTENISTHRDWRNRGLAGALLVMSLHELRDRGMTQAALGVDTNNPGGAFQLYTALGFELRAYDAVYVKAAN